MLTGRPASAWATRSWHIPWVVGVTILALFFRVVWFAQLDWDDHFIVEAPLVTSPGWATIQWAFTNTDQALRYYPAAWLGWALTSVVTPGIPMGHHIGNLVLHALNAVLLAVCIRRVLEQMDVACPKGWDLLPELIALAWAVHPLRVEPVAWITGRPYVQAAFFLLCSVWLHIRSPARGAGRIFSVVCFVLALLSHPIAIPWAMLFPVLDHVMGRKGSLRRVVPYALGAVLVACITLAVRLEAHGAWAARTTPVTAGVAFKALYVFAYFAVAPFLPVNLSPFRTEMHGESLEAPEAILTTTTWLVMGILFWILIKHARWLAALAGMHFAALSVVTGVTDPLPQVSDRYSYLQGMVWTGVMAWCVVTVVQSKPTWLRMVQGVSAVLVLFWIAVTSITLERWRNDVAFFSAQARYLAGDRKQPEALWRLGRALRVAGEFGQAREALDEALQQQPLHPIALAERGTLAWITGQRDQALEDMERSLSVQENPEVQRVLGVMRQTQANPGP